MSVSSEDTNVKVCRKGGADYGFAFWRDHECPSRYARVGLPSSTETAQKAGAHVLVLGNQKGGSGKSTVAMHLIVGLMKRGLSVASIDLDADQGTLSRYVQNRISFSEASGYVLDVPEHRSFDGSDAPVRSDADRKDRANLGAVLDELSYNDFIVIDTPGSASPLARLGLTFADTLVTPLNDSFLDLDLLGQVDAAGRKFLTLGTYGRIVLNEHHRRKMSGQEPLDWVVLRNRLRHIDARNKRQVAELLESLGTRLEFRSAGGLGERVVFHELFPKGLTLLDLRDEAVDANLSMSHVAARQEVRSLLSAVVSSVEQSQSSTVRETGSEAANSEPVKKTGLWMTGFHRMKGRRRHVSKHRPGRAEPSRDQVLTSAIRRG